MMQELSHSDVELVNELKEDLLKDDGNCEKTKIPKIRLVIKSVSVPDLVDEDDKDIDDYKEPTTDFNDKVGKKRQRKKDLSGSENRKKKNIKDGDEIEVRTPTREDELQTVTHSDGEWGNEQLEDLLKDVEEYEEPKSPKKRLVKKFVSVPELVVKDEENLDDYTEPISGFIDKVGNKRQRKKDVSVFVENKKQRKKDVSDFEKTKKKQDSVQSSTEVEEMWDYITNDKKNFKEGDKLKVKPRKKEDGDDEIERLFKPGKKKQKEEKSATEIALQVEQVIAVLEIAVEDDVMNNREGKPAINKLMKLPLLNKSLSKKQFQTEFLDHGILNVLKNWLEPLPDGSLPNINIRTAVLKILHDHLHIDLDQDCRRQQLIKSGLGKAIMFLSKTDEETRYNRKLANALINKWASSIYNKKTTYDNILSQKEVENQQKILLRRQITPKVAVTKVIDFDTDLDLSMKPKSKTIPTKGAVRMEIPKPIMMDFKIRPNSKIDGALETRVKLQKKNSIVHERILKRLKQKILKRR